MALRNQPYFPLYVQDYLTDEKLNMCSLETQGVYIKILCIMHKSDDYGTILLKQKDKQEDNICLNFAKKISKMLPIPISLLEKAIIELIDECVLQLDEKNSILSQKRMIKDNDISYKRSKAGSKGGKKTQFAKAKVKAKHQANSEDENEYENEDEIVINNKIPFEIFWDKYDKKIGRPKCESKWNKLKETEQLKILSHIEFYKKATPDKKYRKHPETYLNNKSWNDEIIEGTNGTFKQSGSNFSEPELREISESIRNDPRYK